MRKETKCLALFQENNGLETLMSPTGKKFRYQKKETGIYGINEFLFDELMNLMNLLLAKTSWQLCCRA